MMTVRASGFLKVVGIECGRYVDTDRDRRFSMDSSAHSQILRIGVMFPKAQLLAVPEHWAGKLVAADCETSP